MSSKDCFCETCNKSFHHMGIMRHRAAHRDRKQDCEIEYSDGEIRHHRYAKKELINEPKGGGE